MSDAQELTAQEQAIADQEQALALLADMTIKNDATIQDLARQGMQITHDSLTSTRLAVLLDMVLGPLDGMNTPQPRLAYELQVHQKFTEMFAEVDKQVRLQKLTAGVNQAIQSNGNGGLIH